MITDRLKRWSEKPWSRGVEARPGYKATWYRSRTGMEVSLLDSGKYRCSYDSEDLHNYMAEGTTAAAAVAKVAGAIEGLADTFAKEVALIKSEFSVEGEEVPAFEVNEEDWIEKPPKLSVDKSTTWVHRRVPSLHLRRQDDKGEADEAPWLSHWSYEDLAYRAARPAYPRYLPKGRSAPAGLIEEIIQQLEDQVLLYQAETEDLRGVERMIRSKRLLLEKTPGRPE